MEKKIYIQLLNEGTKVYRPVSAFEIGNNVYEVQDREIYNPDDEVWEFIPGTFVIVEEQNHDGEIILVAIKEQEKH
jgi:hypothetical protein